MYGIEIKNTNAQIQIDSTYVNLMKYETGSILLSSNYSTNVPFTNYNGGAPVIAFKLLSEPISIGYIYKSGDNWASFDVHHKPNSGTLNYVIWRELSSSLPAGSGLVVYDASNNVVFNSNDPVMKLIGAHSGTLADGSGNSTTVSVQDADNNYFMIFPFSSGIYIYDITTPYFWHARVFRGIEKLDSYTVNVVNYEMNLGRSQVTTVDMSAWEDSFTIVELSL